MLAPGGRLVVYEWVLDASLVGPRDVALFALMMMVENEGGATYTEPEIVGWLQAAGLRHDATRRGFGPIATITATRA